MTDLERLRLQHYDYAAGQDAPPCGNCGHERDDHVGEDNWKVCFGTADCTCEGYTDEQDDDPPDRYDERRERDL